jgi:hypothetical protein
MDRMGTALLWVAGIMVAVALAVVVVGNDGGSATEVAFLEGTPAQATSAECDAMYHAIWRVQEEPSHSTLVSITLDMGCPMEDK